MNYPAVVDGDERAAERILKEKVWIKAQYVVNRRVQVGGPERIFNRIFSSSDRGAGDASALHASAGRAAGAAGIFPQAQNGQAESLLPQLAPTEKNLLRDHETLDRVTCSWPVT